MPDSISLHRDSPKDSTVSDRTPVVVFNPAAGRRRRRRLEATLAALDSAGYAYRLEQTGGPGHAAEIARSARAKGAATVIVAGGDGTINEAIKGLVSPGAEGEPPALAIIPLGTANVLANEIGLSTDPRQVAGAIAAGRVKRVCLGEANGRVFTTMAGVGFDAQVVDGIDLAAKRRIGKGAYVLGAAGLLMRFAFPTYRITADGEVYGCASAIVAKGRFYAGRFVCAPAARLEEPSFQLCLFERPGRLAALRYAAALGLGVLPRLSGYRIVTARELSIEGPEGDPVQGDGDIITRLPATLRVLPSALGLVVP